MARILLVGTATLDMVFELDRYPGADDEMRARALRVTRGGNAANSAVVLARLGNHPEFLGVLADAPEAGVITRDFDQHGVLYAQSPVRTGKPPTSSIYLSSGLRSIVHFRDLPELDATDFFRLDLLQYAWLHFEARNIPQLKEMLQYARRQCPHIPISIELEKYREGLESILELADVLLCSRGMAAHYGHDDPESFLRWLAPQTAGASLILAWGAWGAFALSPATGFLHAPTPGVEVVDSLGAGDAFNAAILHGLSAGEALPDVLQLACAVASRKCAVHGFSFDVCGIEGVA